MSDARKDGVIAIKLWRLEKQVDDLIKENEKLKEQLEGYKKWYQDELEENFKLSQLWCDSKARIAELEKQLEADEEQSAELINKQVSKGIDLLIKFKTQQKEFIEYLENKINDWSSDDDIDYEVVEPTPQEIFEDVLLKYKKIIGVKDE